MNFEKSIMKITILPRSYFEKRMAGDEIRSLF